MKRKFLSLAAIALATVSISALASCGSSQVSNDTLVIGMETTYQPFNWSVTSANEYTLPIKDTSEFADGYDIQVAKYLSEDLNKPVEIVRTVWDSLIPALNSGEINMILAGMSATEERKEEIDFTDPYLTSDLAFLVQKQNIPEGNSADNPLSYDDLLDLFSGEILVCQRGVVGDDFIDTYFTSQDSSIMHATPLGTYPEAATDVLSGNAFAMPAELPVCSAMVNIHPEELGVLYVDQSFIHEEDLVGLSVCIGVKKGNTELLNELNSSLAKLTVEERSEMMGAAAIRSAESAA